MKKSELKKILKPLIKECIKEAMLEGDVLSSIISEVVEATAELQAPLVEAASNPLQERMRQNAFSKEQSKKLKNQKKQLMAAIGKSSYNGINLFEGTTPAPGQTSVTSQASPLANVAPGDSGVDISGLFGSVGRNWSAHMTSTKESKE